MLILFFIHIFSQISRHKNNIFFRNIKCKIKTLYEEGEDTIFIEKPKTLGTPLCLSTLKGGLHY